MRVERRTRENVSISTIEQDGRSTAIASPPPLIGQSGATTNDALATKQ